MNLTWTIELTLNAKKELIKLDKKIQKKILKFLNERVLSCDDPRRFGKALAYDKYGLWSYRVQDTRIICRIEDELLVVLVIRVGHRKDVYDF